jgi:alcohol dehydrogenase class IV
MTVVSAGFFDRPWTGHAAAVLDGMAAHMRVHRGLPTPESIADLHAEVRAVHPDVLVAIGGGSVIDATKVAAALVAGGVGGPRLAAHIRASGPVPTAGIPVVAVPTTPGTGAEVTPFATVWDPTSDRKLSVSGPAVRPAGALLDPQLLGGLPLAQLASCVLDTLAQGIEAAWSVQADASAIAYGLAAVSTVAPLLDPVANRCDSTSVRTALLLAGYHSGAAIARAETTACHAVSYPLTLRLGLAHGHACGAVLGRLLRYNAAVTERSCRDSRGVAHVRRVIADIVDAFDDAGDGAGDGAFDGAGDGAVSGVGGVDRRIDDFLSRCALPRYDELAVDHAQVAAAAVRYSRCHNNPRALDARALTDLLSAPAPSVIGDLQCCG